MLSPTVSGGEEGGEFAWVLGVYSKRKAAPVDPLLLRAGCRGAVPGFIRWCKAEMMQLAFCKLWEGAGLLQQTSTHALLGKDWTQRCQTGKGQEKHSRMVTLDMVTSPLCRSGWVVPQEDAEDSGMRGTPLPSSWRV